MYDVWLLNERFLGEFQKNFKKPLDLEYNTGTSFVFFPSSRKNNELDSFKLSNDFDFNLKRGLNCTWQHHITSHCNSKMHKGEK